MLPNEPVLRPLSLEFLGRFFLENFFSPDLELLLKLLTLLLGFLECLREADLEAERESLFTLEACD